MYRYMRFTRLVKQTQLHTQNYRIHLTVYTKATSIDTMFVLTAKPNSVKEME